MSWYTTVPRLPIIDLSLYEMGDPWRDHVAAQLDWAAREFGSFYAIGHGIDSAHTEAVVQSVSSFFRMVEAGAVRLARLSPDASGVGGHLAIKGDPNRSSLLSEVPELRQTISEYVQGLTGLAHKLMGLLGRALQLGPSYFADQVTGSSERELHVIDPSVDEGGGFGPGTFRHSGLLSLTYQAGDSGLQLEHETGWIAVPYVPDSFVVTIAAGLERLTHGQFRAPLQRHLPGPRAQGVFMPFIFKLPDDRRSEIMAPRDLGRHGERIAPAVSLVTEASVAVA
jgi:isopenicillin N synthase-like dioxygenase